jgi:hypothetical protein
MRYQWPMYTLPSHCHHLWHNSFKMATIVKSPIGKIVFYPTLPVHPKGYLVGALFYFPTVAGSIPGEIIGIFN